MKELNNVIESLNNQVEFAQDNISECQTNIVQVEEAKVMYHHLSRYGKYPKISNTFLYLFFKYNVAFQGWNSQNDGQNSKQGRHRSDCFFCTVCLGLYGGQLVFEILEHLPLQNILSTEL